MYGEMEKRKWGKEGWFWLQCLLYRPVKKAVQFHEKDFKN
jgi:hypothetical protein